MLKALYAILSLFIAMCVMLLLKFDIYFMIYLVQPHWKIIQPIRPRAQQLVHEKAHPVVSDIY